MANNEEPVLLAERMEDAPRADMAAVIRRHQAGVWRYLRSLGCAPDLADDLTQETFLVALGRQLRDPGPAALAGYLRRTARFIFLRTHRTSRRRDEILADAVDLLWERDLAADDGEAWLDALRECVELLEGRSRLAVSLFYATGASRAAVAQALEMKTNGVKTLLHRVRHTLRQCVERKMS